LLVLSQISLRNNLPLARIASYARSKLQTKLRLSGRPAYVPSEGKLIADVNTAWAGLDAAEAANKEWILAELRR
jgi:hypothetical protein